MSRKLLDKLLDEALSKEDKEFYKHEQPIPGLCGNSSDSGKILMVGMDGKLVWTHLPDSVIITT
jgi:hypothetical protein